ncbi:hypothetical protein TNCV_3694051 [Trichonephila clavipes]|nr:hypothetical protein TNCV_3694051 [Trichonephila clavipes]
MSSEGKRKFFEYLFKNVEHLRGSNEGRAFFPEINLGCKDFKPSSCHNMEGAILSDKTEVLRGWNEHFNLLSSDNGEYEALTRSVESQSQGGVEPPSLEEDIKVINKLKRHPPLRLFHLSH